MHDVSRLPSSAKYDVQAPPVLMKQRRRILRRLGFAVLIIVAAVAEWGAWGYHQRRTAALQTLNWQQNLIPAVRATEVKAVRGPRELSLPGTTQAFDSATVYARAIGYIAKRLVDIGSRVKAGEVLAIIAAPELDQQLAQARAQLNQLEAALVQARANADLARATNERTSKLVGQGWLFKQKVTMTA